MKLVNNKEMEKGKLWGLSTNLSLISFYMDAYTYCLCS